MTDSQRAREADYVPGVMHCAGCNFRLQRITLFVGNGATAAGDNKTEPCPNGCGPLWPVTWKQEAQECYKLLDEAWDKIKALERVASDSKPANEHPSRHDRYIDAVRQKADAEIDKEHPCCWVDEELK